MNKEDRADAASALARWFQSQEMNHADAAEVMGLVLAAIIGNAAPHDAQKQQRGIAALSRDVARAIKQMNLS